MDTSPTQAPTPVTPSVPTPPPVTPVQSDSKGILFYVLLFLLIAIVVGGGWYVYYSSKQISNTQQPAETPTPSSSVDTLVEVTPVQGVPIMVLPEEWTVYTDSQSQFSFQLPPGFEETDSDSEYAVVISDCREECVEYMKLAIAVDYDNTSPQNWLAKKKIISSTEAYTYETMFVQSQKATIAREKAETQGDQTVALIPSEKKAYVFAFPSSGKSEEEITTIRQIISSFTLL